MQLILKYVIVMLMFLPCVRLAAQADSVSGEQKVTIKKIHITGNRKTKEKIILREISFSEGQQYVLSDLVRRFEDARKQLMNTILFHEVMVALKSLEGTDAEIIIEVRERWYLFPVPYFKFVDRNLNQWLFEQNARLDRVNYGVKVLHNNATGYNDKFNLWLINGYTKQVILGYERPYIDKQMKWGANFQISFGKNREVNYATLGNKQTFFKDTNSFVRSFFKTNVELTHRPAIKTRHRFGIAFTSEKVVDTIITLNPEYFEKDRNSLKFGELYYIMTYFDVDYIPYPLTGYLAEFSFLKRGFSKDANMWQTQLKLGGGWKIANKTYFGARASGSIKLPFKQPFYNQRFLGYSDFFMQGYEYYVVDGVAGGYVKATVTRELFDFDIFYRLKKGARLERIPFRFFARIYANAGYAYNPEPGTNPITNNMMYSTGIGLDVLTLYDLTLRVEWSVNRLGENGVYLHRKINF